MQCSFKKKKEDLYKTSEMKQKIHFIVSSHNPLCRCMGKPPQLKIGKKFGNQKLETKTKKNSDSLVKIVWIG